MLYYHLIVEDKNRETKFLKNEPDLKKIIEKSKKYVNKEDFRIDGYVFNNKINVGRFKIVTTEKHPKDIAELKTQECFRDGIIRVYSENDIIESDEFTKDITDEVLDNL